MHCSIFFLFFFPLKILGSYLHLPSLFSKIEWKPDTIDEAVVLHLTVSFPIVMCYLIIWLECPFAAGGSG